MKYYNELYTYSGALPDTEGAWTDHGEPFLAGASALVFLGALGSEAFEVRTVQGARVGETIEWLVNDDTLEVPSGRVAGDGVFSQVGFPVLQLQVKTAGVVANATIVLGGRWMGR